MIFNSWTNWTVFAFASGGLCGMAFVLIVSSSFKSPTPARQFRSTEQMNHLLEQHPSLKKEDIDLVLNLFHEEQNPAGEKVIEKQKIEETTLPLRLLGTIFTGDSLNGTATIETLKGKFAGQVASFNVGEMIAQNVQLVGVFQQKCLVNNSGRYETITIKAAERKQRTRLPTAPTVQQPTIKNDPRQYSYAEDGLEVKSGKIRMTQQKRDHLLSKLPEILQGALAKPYLVDGVITGWTLTKVKPDSIFSQLGIVDGDIVEEINGMKLSDASQAIKILSDARNADSLEFRLNRGGVSYDFKLDVF